MSIISTYAVRATVTSVTLDRKGIRLNTTFVLQTPTPQDLGTQAFLLTQNTQEQRQLVLEQIKNTGRQLREELDLRTDVEIEFLNKVTTIQP